MSMMTSVLPGPLANTSIDGSCPEETAATAEFARVVRGPDQLMIDVGGSATPGSPHLGQAPSAGH